MKRKAKSSIKARREKKDQKSDIGIASLTFEQIDSQNNLESINSVPSHATESLAATLKNPHDPAWIDKNDQEISIDISKVARLRKLIKKEGETTIQGDQYQDRLQEFYSKKLHNLDFFKWGSQKVQESDGKETDFRAFLNQDIQLFEKKTEELPNGLISIKKLGSLLRKEEHNAVVQTIDFHKNNEVFLSAGYDKMMKLYSVKKEEKIGLMEDGFKKNLKILKKAYFEGFPLKKCQFLLRSNQVLCSGLKKHLLSYDIVSERTEKYASNLFTAFFDKSIDNFSVSHNEELISLNNNQGDIVVLSGKNREYLYHLKCNEPCTTTQFSHDDRFLFSASSSGKIYQWDLNKRMVFDCVRDIAASAINSMDVSFNDNYVAVGGSNGIVDIFEKEPKINKLKRSPLKEVQNLTTAITNLEFSGNGEYMAIASKWKKNAIRLVHMGTRTVFSNWPNFKTKLQFITSLKLSQNCKYLVLGNDEGNVFLYNVRHYN